MGMIRTICSPEFLLTPFLSLDAPPIELWYSQRHLVVDVLVQDSHEYGGQRSKCQIDQQYVGIVEEIGAIEVVVDLIPEQRERPNDILHRVSDFSATQTTCSHGLPCRRSSRLFPPNGDRTICHGQEPVAVGSGIEQ